MKTLKEIFAPERKIEDIINDLKYYKDKMMEIPAWSEIEKEFDPKLHRIITDKTAYPDKAICDDKGNTLRYEPVTRIAVGLQKLAANRLAEFLFTIPVKSISENDEETATEQLKSVKKILKKNKWNSLNKRRARIISSECECATLWYVVESKNSSYGFDSKFKLKNVVFSPEKGDKLYPTFDDTGDMIAFSREFEKKDGANKSITVFETWTAEEHIVFEKGEKGWEEIFNTTAEDGTGIRDLISIGKIPIVYTTRKQPIWRDGDSGKVHEIEVLLSRNGDTIAYHSAPVLMLIGDLIGAPTKGESNKVFFGKTGADAKYVSWQQAPEAVKFQFETLLRLFFMEIQLPDISFESLKGIGALSSLAIAMLFSDAHLKCGDESEIYEEMFEREYNVIKAFLAEMNTSWRSTIDNLEIEPEITPFMINDEKTTVEMLVAASGNKALISQKTAIQQAAFVEDAEAELDQIKQEGVSDLGNSFN